MIKKTFSIFDINTKIEAIFLFILNFLSALLEVISISSIPIFLYYILEPDKLISKIPFENVQLFIGEFLKNNSTSESLFLILIPIVFIFVFKNIFIFLVSIYQVYFSRKIKTRYTTLLFKKYIYEKYDFFLDKNPAQFIKNLDSVHIIPGIIMISLGIIKELSIIIGLVLMIAFTNLNISILLVFIVLIAFLLHKFKLGEILQRQGKKSYHYQESRYALINEFFGSIIDIKVLNKEKFFSKIFKDFIWEYETSITISKAINAFIRPFVETLGILIMVSTVIYFSYLGKAINEIIPIISFLALSFIRIVPSSVTLISNFNYLKFEKKQLGYLVDNFNLIKTNLKKNITSSVKKYNFENTMELKNINFSYKNYESKSISNVSFKIEKNNQIAIIGKTGSGKSTLINLICNLLKFSSGQIILDNEKIINPNEDYHLENLHYIRQDIYLLNDSIKKNVAFGKNDNDIDEDLVIDCLKKVGLGQYTNQLSKIIGNRGAKISGGEKQLLGLARALYRKPKFLILDEPTSNLDYKNEKSYFEVIKKLKITLIVIAHRVSTLEYCNKIILLKNGNIEDQGSLENFKKKYENLTNYIN